jgi:hypothetical protein
MEVLPGLAHHHPALKTPRIPMEATAFLAVI